MAEVTSETFATCFSCMDGRVLLPATEFIKQTYGVQYVDIITEAGMDGFLAHSGPIDGLLRKLDISLQKHSSKFVFIVGHEDCSGNVVDEAQHQKDIAEAITRLKLFRTVPAIGGLWISKQWKARPLSFEKLAPERLMPEKQPVKPPVAPTPPVAVASRLAPVPPTWNPADNLFVKPAVKATLPRMTPATAPVAAKPTAAKPAPHADMICCKTCQNWNEHDSAFCDQCGCSLRY